MLMQIEVNRVQELLKTEIKQIDIAVAILLNIMQYYAKLKNNLEDKLSYIQKIKIERNVAQDQIQELLKISNTSNFKELKNLLKKSRQTT